MAATDERSTWGNLGVAPGSQPLLRLRLPPCSAGQLIVVAWHVPPAPRPALQAEQSQQEEVHLSIANEVAVSVFGRDIIEGEQRGESDCSLTGSSGKVSGRRPVKANINSLQG